MEPTHTETLTGAEARAAMLEGIDEVANIVKQTLGPAGRNVVLDNDPYRDPLITNDGVTIARAINPIGTFERTGAKFVKAAASKTDDVVGDGTTTSVVLIQAIIQAGLQAIDKGQNVVAVRRGIELAAKSVVAELEAQKVDVSDEDSLASIATISSGDPDLGKLIASVVHKLGAGGVVTVEDSSEDETTSRLIEGLEIRGGIPSGVFVNKPATQEAVYNDVPVIVTDMDITNGIEAVKFMEAAAATGAKSAVLIANNIVGEAMNTIVLNMLKQKFTILPLRVQAWGETGQAILGDVAAATGATLLTKETGFVLPNAATDVVDSSKFGHATRVIATRDRTTVVADSDDRQDRIEELEAQLPNEKVAYLKEALEQRIAKLKAGVGVISVGGVTDTEREERKLRIEDAIKAAKAALDGGVVAGGGSALYRAQQKIADLPQTDNEDERAGKWAVLDACKVPLLQMVSTSSYDLSDDLLLDLVVKQSTAFDFSTGNVVSAQEAGILDPVKVVTTALKNAASESAMFLTSEAAVVAIHKTND